VVFAAGSPPGPKQSTNMVLVRTIEE
jgi:hypothetical protein